MMYDEVKEWLAGARRAIEAVDVAAVARAGEALADVRFRGGTIFAAGNGGSASTANHFACDLQKATRVEGRGTRAISLSDNAALLTAWGNDLSFDSVFAEQLRLMAARGDALVLFSVSGSSPNLIEALSVAREMNLITVALLGRDGGRAALIVDHAVIVESDDYGWVESAHLVLEHVLTCYVRRAMRERLVTNGAVEEVVR
ncbi:MAG: SIS domain-containing protein [Candidatus Eisenbacteria bacterium]|uniref:SIS domain-containing protein n=1 Tax=Eiseniibacteriota bacterium TaxID=2212470 RepID=A0A538TAF3_UNCEI|nr:MAG: SIS domain-containing protein [Candidatus Eisenbacteria bacterium]